MSRCGDGSLVYSGDRFKVAITQRCRCWSCEHCEPGCKRRVIALACGGHPTKFLTLTSRRRPNLSASEAARELKQAWTVMRRHWERLHPGKKISFIAVFEKTKRGWPHLHIAMRCPFIAHAWLSQQMRKLIDSPVVGIEAIDGTKKVASYIAKYIGKDPERFKGCKRYWTSLDYDEREPRTDPEWIDGSSSWRRSASCLITLHRNWLEHDYVEHTDEPDRLIMERPP